MNEDDVRGIVYVTLDAPGKRHRPQVVSEK